MDTIHGAKRPSFGSQDARRWRVQVSKGILADLVTVELMDVSSAIIAQSSLLVAKSLNAAHEAQCTLNDVHCGDESKWVEFQLRLAEPLIQLFQSVVQFSSKFSIWTTFLQARPPLCVPEFSLHSTRLGEAAACTGRPLSLVHNAVCFSSTKLQLIAVKCQLGCCNRKAIFGLHDKRSQFYFEMEQERSFSTKTFLNSKLKYSVQACRSLRRLKKQNFKSNPSCPLQLCMISHNTGLLFSVDYEVEAIDNEDGQICATYPLKMLFLKGLKGEEAVQSTSILREPLQHGARFGRVRTRFPMPVILYRGRNICRSSSLTMRLEALVQTTHNSIRDTLSYADGSGTVTSPEQGANLQEPSDSNEMAELLQTLQSDTSTAMDKHRLADITLIRTLKVSHIADLMLENSKKFMGVAVCSSEKNDSYKRYADFTLLVLPYPGVEFFRHFNPIEPQLASSLHFDWSNWPPVNRPPGSLSYDHELICNWDSVTITQNYLKTMLYSLGDSTCNGLLVHCISGWDRTPLFVSLLRLSLWADGEIHQSLTAEQMLYLTVAYDWMLFRHQLVLRQMHSEDIFAFCFYFLEHITSADYSMHTITNRIGNGSCITSIPHPAPVYRPSILSFVSSDEDYSANGSYPSSSANPSQAYSTIKAKSSKSISTPSKKKSRDTKNASSNDSFGSQPSNSSSKPKSFLDGLIISSYHGNSKLEEAMAGHQLQDIVYRNTDDEMDEDFSPASSYEDRSDDSPSSSFQSLSFGDMPRAPPPSFIDSPHIQSSPISPSLHIPTDDIMPHPLDGDTAGQSPLTPADASLNPAIALRKERLDAVRNAFIKQYHATMQPFFAAKRATAPSGLWKWLPTFGLSGSADSLKRH